MLLKLVVEYWIELHEFSEGCKFCDVTDVSVGQFVKKQNCVDSDHQTKKSPFNHMHDSQTKHMTYVFTVQFSVI